MRYELQGKTQGERLVEIARLIDPDFYGPWSYFCDDVQVEGTRIRVTGHAETYPYRTAIRLIAPTGDRRQIRLKGRAVEVAALKAKHRELVHGKASEEGATHGPH